MTYQGWIKLHRRTLGNPICKRPDHCHVWMVLLLLAQHDPSEYIWNGEKKTLQSGQLLTGRKSLSVICGLHESKIQRILRFLEIEQQIEQQKTNKFRVITIKNWAKYQGNGNSEHQSEQPVNNKRTTDEQQANTYKNVKKDKNEKNVKEGLFAVTPNAFKDYWNKTRLPKIRSLTEQRRRQLKIRMSEPEFAKQWMEIIDKIAASDFCNGENDRKWKADIDWLLKNDTYYNRVLEGKYNNKGEAKPKCYSCPATDNLKWKDVDGTKTWFCPDCEEPK